MPVFLDAPDVIRVELPEPSTLASLKSVYTLKTKSGTVTVIAVSPAAPPVQDNSAPRDAGQVVIAGTLQSALGGAEWDPGSSLTRMTETGSGVFELVVRLPKGRYEYKLARGGSWTENYGDGFAPGGSNIAIEIPEGGSVVRFVADFNKRTLTDSVRDPSGTPAPATAPVRAPVDLSTSRFDQVALALARPIRPGEVAAPMKLVGTDGSERTVFARDILSGPEYSYSKSDLGSRWTAEYTTFKVWSPVSSSAEVLLYGSVTDAKPETVAMKRGAKGVWYVRVPGNLHGRYYRYRFHSYGKVRETPDINCYAAGADSRLSMVTDLKRTDPKGWPGKAMPTRQSQTEAVIYEVHVRDFTALPSSGVRPEWRGKYLGMVEPGTHVPGSGQATGIDYLRGLGITDVHLLPIQNSSAGRPGDYSWGYATTLFNAPEEHYSTTPDDPANVIRELKAMVAGLHMAGIRAVMDVVYNHTWPPDGEDSAFQQTVPYYYVRSDNRGNLLNESGVGNAMADERPMVRKYIRDSLLYWLKEYRIDGFRFDLIGMHYPDSVEDWAKALRKANPSVLLYGEPWTGGGPTHFGKGAQKGMRVAVFNDDFRNTIRGDLDGTGLGFSTGGGASFETLKQAVTGTIDGWALSPEETINYVSAHDNKTMWDKVRSTLPDANRDEQARAVKLANAAVLLSQGIPFLEGGVEIGRTKGGDHNSYNKDDIVNGFHWEHAADYNDTQEYLRGLIALRNSLPVLRLYDTGEIRTRMKFLDATTLPPNTIAWELAGTEGGKWKRILVVLHGQRSEASLQLPDGDWNVLVDGDIAGVVPLRTVKDNLSLAPLSAFVLARK